MSEQNKNPQNPETTERPIPSTEQLRAFRGVYSQLMKITSLRGAPIMINGRHSESSFVTEDEYNAVTWSKKDFVKDASVSRLKISDGNGEPSHGFATVLTEEPARKYGVLAHLEILDAGAGSHPADVYWLYPDHNIEHIRRTSEGDDYNQDWREINTHVEWLDSEQMENLQLRVEEAQ